MASAAMAPVPRPVVVSGHVTCFAATATPVCYISNRRSRTVTKKRNTGCREETYDGCVANVQAQLLHESLIVSSAFACQGTEEDCSKPYAQLLEQAQVRFRCVGLGKSELMV